MSQSHTHVLSEALREHDLVALLHEESHGEGVVVDAARCEALVRHVEEREQLPVFYHLSTFIFIGYII